MDRTKICSGRWKPIASGIQFVAITLLFPQYENDPQFYVHAAPRRTSEQGWQFGVHVSAPSIWVVGVALDFTGKLASVTLLRDVGFSCCNFLCHQGARARARRQLIDELEIGVSQACMSLIMTGNSMQ